MNLWIIKTPSACYIRIYSLPAHQINILKKQVVWTKKHKIYLIVTHGVFSKGFEELSKYFEGIYCTNSYGDALSQRDGDLPYEYLVKQLNIF